MNAILVLIVDDDAEIRDVLKSHLESLGCVVHVAINGVEALAKFQSEEFDIVITDNDMPKMNGVELIRAVKTIRNVPVAMITGGLTTREVAVSAGADEYFEKPFALNELELFVLQAEIKQLAAI